MACFTPKRTYNARSEILHRHPPRSLHAAVLPLPLRRRSPLRSIRTSLGRKSRVCNGQFTGRSPASHENLTIIRYVALRVRDEGFVTEPSVPSAIARRSPFLGQP